MLLHSPQVADRVATVGEFLLYKTILPPMIKTLTWLISACEWNCEYEYALVASAAHRAGVPNALIEAIRNRQKLDGATGEQKLLTDFCNQLLRGNHHVSDATYHAVVAHFGVPATVQIAITVGYFVMQAFLLNAFEVQPEGDPSELVL